MYSEHGEQTQCTFEVNPPSLAFSKLVSRCQENEDRTEGREINPGLYFKNHRHEGHQRHDKHA
jgi:hypothetical protein